MCVCVFVCVFVCVCLCVCFVCECVSCVFLLIWDYLVLHETHASRYVIGRATKHVMRRVKSEKKRRRRRREEERQGNNNSM